MRPKIIKESVLAFKSKGFRRKTAGRRTAACLSFITAVLRTFNPRTACCWGLKFEIASATPRKVWRSVPRLARKEIIFDALSISGRPFIRRKLRSIEGSFLNAAE
jgi:hypothetical protein